MLTSPEEAFEFGQAGVVVRLSDGALAILVAWSGSAYAVIFDAGKLRCVIRAAIEQAPARCATCGQTFWWWHDDHQPQCLYCLPPSSDWREQVLSAADRFIEKAEAMTKAEVAWARAIRDRALRVGGRSWGPVQKMAFYWEDMPRLMLEWLEQEKPR